MINTELENQIFNIADQADFTSTCLAVFKFQYENVACYREFCDLLGRTTPKSVNEIPFLPISFFKTHKVIIDNVEHKKLFKSSGTTASTRSHHYIYNLSIYERSFFNCFEENFGRIEEKVILALLPNYVEQGESSLVYMVDKLIEKTNDARSGFYLSNNDKLLSVIETLKKENKKIILFGVSYALLDLAEIGVDFSGVEIIETGGMKGRRKELIKEELHEQLKKGLNVSSINSEYGMTELLSQAYLKKDLWFNCPPWMRIYIREINDALSFVPDQKTGGVNIIDLANLYSCSFIATDDLGKKSIDMFKILGRFDNSDVRGCNLLIN